MEKKDGETACKEMADENHQILKNIFSHLPDFRV